MIPLGDVGAVVDLTWWRGQAESWIRFGQPVDEIIHDRRRRTVVFAPGSVFAVVRWASGDYGTTRSELDILRSVPAGDAYVTRVGVRPGAEILAALTSWPRVRRALDVIDALEARGIAPCTASPDYWRHVHNRLSVGLEPRAYDLVRHRAWLARRKVTS